MWSPNDTAVTSLHKLHNTSCLFAGIAYVILQLFLGNAYLVHNKHH